jgi:competence protein ComEA
MKMLNLCLALIFSLSVCFVVAPDNSYAAPKVEKADTSTKSAKDTKKALSKAININTADKTMLTELPGVGPATADAILNYRKANGSFKTANDLLNVKGIGEKTLKKMKPFLKV